VGDVADGLGEGHAVAEHEEFEDVAADSAGSAVALEGLPAGGDGEAGGFLLVEGTAADPDGAAALEMGQFALEDLHDVGFFAEALDGGVRDAHGNKT